MHPIIRLVNRNLTISLNMGFVIWQIVFPLIYIFVAGFAYTSLIHQVQFGNKTLDYPAFIATGMIGFNIMNSTLGQCDRPVHGTDSGEHGPGGTAAGRVSQLAEEQAAGIGHPYRSDLILQHLRE